MRNFLLVIITSASVFGMSAIVFPGQENIRSHAIQHKDDAGDTMKELERRGQDAKNQAKGEATRPTQAEEIQTRRKEDINNTLDSIKEDIIGR